MLGVFTLAYVVIGGTQFFLEKQVEDKLKALQQDKNSLQTAFNIEASTEAGFEMPGSAQEGPNRAERRLKQRIRDNKDANTKKP